MHPLSSPLKPMNSSETSPVNTMSDGFGGDCCCKKIPPGFVCRAHLRPGMPLEAGGGACPRCAGCGPDRRAGSRGSAAPARRAAASTAIRSAAACRALGSRCEAQRRERRLKFAANLRPTRRRWRRLHRSRRAAPESPRSRNSSPTRMQVSPRTANLRNNSPYMSARTPPPSSPPRSSTRRRSAPSGRCGCRPCGSGCTRARSRRRARCAARAGSRRRAGGRRRLARRRATPRRGDDEFGGFQVDIPVSLRRPTSPALRPTSPALTSPHRRPSTLNNASTFSYNAEPPYPQLTHPSNDAISVGSLSMLGSQALSHRHSSGAYGFGTSKRYGGEMTQYISPAHLKSRLCVDSPGPSMCAATQRSGPPPDKGPQPTHLRPLPHAQVHGAVEPRPPGARRRPHLGRLLLRIGGPLRRRSTRAVQQLHAGAGRVPRLRAVTRPSSTPPTHHQGRAL